jgi:hypothetical protein
MKQIYTTLIALLIGLTTFANNDKAKATGNWATATNWNLNRLPQDGDTITIPAGYTVTVDANYPLDNAVIIVYGILDLDNGKLHLNDNSKVILALGGKLTGSGANDQLWIGTTEKYKGTEGTLIGYSIADASTGSTPHGFVAVASSTLPVTFQSFYATRQDNNIQLTWVTSEEINNSYYAVERSTNGSNWKQIAVVLGAGTTEAVSRYSYTDKNISDAVVYYRIRQVDINGSAHYSAVRTVRNSQTAQVTNIYASAKQTITIDFNSDVKDNVTVQVINMNGQVIARQQYKSASYRLTMNVLSAGSGAYVVQVSDNTGWSEVKKIIL